MSGRRKRQTRIPRTEFVARVRAWCIPSLRCHENNNNSTLKDGGIVPEGSGGDGNDLDQYVRSMSRWRRVRSYWTVHGPQIAFIAIVVGLQMAFSLWISIRYATSYRHDETFSWGTVVSKACAGALLPSLVFLMLSMSRYALCSTVTRLFFPPCSLYYCLAFSRYCTQPGTRLIFKVSFQPALPNRYLSTFLRRSYHISRFINWDLSQRFHVQMAVVVVILSTIHTAGHLAGTFVRVSSLPGGVVPVIVYPTTTTTTGGPSTYRDYLAAPASLSGLLALGVLYLMCLLSLPAVRRWNHELFQYSHLFLYLFVGALVAHGSMELLHPSMLEWFLVVPTAVILLEHVLRIALSCRRLPAALTILDDDVVEIRTTIPRERLWRYRAGQYVLLQVPQVSLLQWHPFTVSVCGGRDVWLHIKTGGNWTKRVRDLARGRLDTIPIEVGINGPFGAPAQRFYDYSHTIVVGAGIGVTPFSGILADLQTKHNHVTQDMDVDTSWTSTSAPTLYSPYDSCAEDKDLRTSLQAVSRTSSCCREKPSREFSINSPIASLVSKKRHDVSEDYRRVDFHWIVRDKTHLLWFADLLNAVSCSQLWRRFFPRPYYVDTNYAAFSSRSPFERSTTTTTTASSMGPTTRASPSTLDINMNTYITRSDAQDLTTHVCHWLLEKHLRTPEHPESHLTGLLNSTQLGRPDFVRIMTDHYEEMRVCQVSRRLTGGSGGGGGNVVKTLKVGVFFCGTPILGEVLSDMCRGLTARGRHEGTKIEYHFHREAF